MTLSLPLPKEVCEVVLPFSTSTVTETMPLKIAISYAGNHTLRESSSCPQTSRVLAACLTSTFYDTALVRHPQLMLVLVRTMIFGVQVRCSMTNTDENVASRSFEHCRTGMVVIPVKGE